VSRTGTLVYTSGGSAGATRAFWVSREGVASVVDSTWDPQGTISAVALAPDGKSLAVTLQRGAQQDIWVKRIPTGPFSRITFGDTARFRATWTRDGRSLVYISDRGTGAGEPQISRADGTGRPQVMLHSPFNFGQAFQSADGRWLLLRRALNEPGAGDIFAVRTGDTTVVPLLTSSSTEVSPSLSPDGRWLAYVSDESGNPEVYVRPFPDVASARWQVSLSGGSLPVWAPNGRELFYLTGQQELASVAVTPGGTFSAAEPRVLFSASAYNLATSAGGYDVSPDGRRFLMVRPLTGPTETELVLVQNWFEDLKARAKK
jgi:Tol biopolymer transport system component